VGQTPLKVATPLAPEVKTKLDAVRQGGLRGLVTATIGIGAAMAIDRSAGGHVVAAGSHPATKTVATAGRASALMLDLSERAAATAKLTQAWPLDIPINNGGTIRWGAARTTTSLCAPIRREVTRSRVATL